MHGYCFATECSKSRLVQIYTWCDAYFSIIMYVVRSASVCFMHTSSFVKTISICRTVHSAVLLMCLKVLFLSERREKWSGVLEESEVYAHMV